MSKSPATYRPETRLVHSGTLRSQYGETSEALFLTQGYVYNSAEECEARFKGEDPGFIYSRYSNPTIAMFERRMIELEGAEAARSAATGMAAVTTAILAPLKAGDHVVASRALFGSCLYVVQDLLPRYGIETTLVDGLDLDQWQRALKPNTKTFFLESPTNPTLDVLDIPSIAEIAHKGGARLVVDNVFATPIWQSPLALGADVVVYSATKHIDGQGRCLGGIILSSEAFIAEHIHNFMRQTGPSISPFNAWVLLKGLETLGVRVRAQTDTAARIAEVLASHPKISRLVYPGRADHPQAALVKKQMRGGSTLVGFELKGGKQAAFRVLNELKLAKISNNLGDAKSLVTHPATTTHQRLKPEDRAALGISEGFIRFSAGLEHAEDLIEDLTAALEKA
ncbi:O-succinylhomoserine sulfhydrylase [Bradyrhizobium sp. 180]|uniref:O-succinylhomoserine sulfhydrylase n=1 Tax=unclassified Bradyrhizobium TaxID=2631580 RepID=UPI001FFAB9ED|nr:MULTISPECIES: O-succinylhomoserine sulfhydrylase [unclassified Bradyrhizobium]MCK1425501.1 O-succinylhomoserine sulfhydrylase [Bradyrhizobium sp. CW12]MCK1493951.1 O-succinylhomoserine sulfhydrylase [Bradyrhizobium sp. 180]MCK1532058.1 O-succinylhomoserine sulfhydrylase [Bradyrhizobium sp. 182]MCK1597971.1 O-succinylhomoserine sulfhydrylase [Bradyrhizobium sp. 164]MCK1644494.1 O-succinylhomoserine sulfhydrylase [Bradyrhizobium sp. 154]